MKRYTFNEDYFEKIDTEEKAYWLGFFYADGCVRIRVKSSESKLKLAIKDLSHLEKFKKCLNGDNKIMIYEKMAYLSLNTRKFANHLINQGCMSRKTFTIKFPYFLNDELFRHFIRGYFDGDGSISASQRRNYSGEVYLTKKNNMLNFVSGSDSMLTSLASILSEKCKTKPRKIYKYNGNKYGYICWWMIDDIESIYHYFYDNSSICLERKKETFEKIIDYERNK